MQSHMEYQIVTPRTLADFQGSVLILPEARIINEAELDQLLTLATQGCNLLSTGETGLYDGARQRLETGSLEALGQAVEKIGTPGADYYKMAHKEFNNSAHTGEWSGNPCLEQLAAFQRGILKSGLYKPEVLLRADPGIVTHIAEVDGQPHVFIANYTGLIANENIEQIPQENIEVLFISGTGDDQIKYLPYLGEETVIESIFNKFGLSASLPTISQAGVVWLEKKI